MGPADASPTSSQSPAASSSIEIRPLERTQVELLQRFLAEQMAREGFGGPGQAAYYAWKYFSDELSGSMSQVAWVNGKEIVGFLGASTRTMVADQHPRRVIEIVDGYVDRAYRRQGVYITLIEAVLAQARRNRVAFAYGRANANALPGLLKLGFVRLDPIVAHSRPLAWRLAHVGSARPGGLLSQLQGAAAQAAAQLSLVPARALALRGIQLEDVEQFDERADRLSTELGRASVPHIEHSGRYLNWRYVACVKSEYLRVQALHKAQVIGFGVAAIPTYADCTEERSAEVVALATASRMPAMVSYLLLGRLLERLEARERAMVRCFLPDSEPAESHRLRGALRLHGFVRRPTNVHQLAGLMLDPEDPLVQSVLSRGHWAFCAGDTDYV